MFHYGTEQKLLTIKQHGISDKCRHEAEFVSELHDLMNSNHDFYDRIDGFAMKLSDLQVYNLDLTELLAITTQSIIIDAEYDRLDLFILELLKDHNWILQEMHRIVITIQVKRQDAENQLLNLKELMQYGLRIVLVAGHQSYLEHTEVSNSKLSDRFIHLASTANIYAFGIGSQMYRRINQQKQLDTGEVLELQGYQKIESSKLWTYYGGQNLTTRGKNYLSRRNSEGNFMAYSVEDLTQLSESHNLILYLDRCCGLYYKTIMAIIDQLVTNQRRK